MMMVCKTSDQVSSLGGGGVGAVRKRENFGILKTVFGTVFIAIMAIATVLYILLVIPGYCAVSLRLI